MMGAPTLLAESMEYGLSYSVASYLKKLSQQVVPQNFKLSESKSKTFCSCFTSLRQSVCVFQAKVEADRVCAFVGKKAGPDVGIKLRLRGSALSLAHRKDFAQLLQSIMGDGPLDINPKEFSGFQLAVLNKVSHIHSDTHTHTHTQLIPVEG